MHFMHPLDCLPLIVRRFEPVAYVNAPDHEDLFFELDLARGLRSKLVVAGIDLARLQRASECARESAGGRSYDVIQGRGVRRISARRDLVVFGDLGMNAKDDRLFLRG